MKKEYAPWRAVMIDSQGRYRVSSLFWETRGDSQDNYPPIFTVKPEPFTVGEKTYPSLRAIYMSYEHAPGFEHEFALDIFGSWDHWVRLTTTSRLADMFQAWRDELAVRNKAKAIKHLMKLSEDSSAVAATAARYLADEGYARRKVGRLSREEKERQLKLDAGVKETLKQDMERLGLEVVSGGKQ